MTSISNIILIGMPGSGKSTVGVILAKMLSKSFLDTDILIQNSSGQSLQDIINRSGYQELRRIEEQVLLSVNCTNHVIATGGSAAYSKKAMLHLHRDALMVFLDASLETLNRRIHNYETRGLAKRPDQSFSSLFAERYALYTRYADLIIDNNEKSQEQVCFEIVEYLDELPLS